jgi:hypothetical protein
MASVPTNTPSSVAWLGAWRVATPGAKIATALSIAATIIVLVMGVPLLIDLVSPAPVPPAKVGDPAKNAEQQKVTFDGYVAQIKGRSLFFVPPPPRAAEPPPEASGSHAPPPPSSYGGPSIVAMLSDVVWFSNGKKMKVGESGDDLEVVSLAPPWTSRLKWKGVEFDVGFFDRQKVIKDGKASSGEPVATEAAKEEAPKDDAKKDDPKKDEPGKDEPKKDEPKKGEPKADEPKKQDVKPQAPPPDGGGPGRRDGPRREDGRGGPRGRGDRGKPGDPKPSEPPPGGSPKP